MIGVSRPPATPEQIARIRSELLDVAQGLYEAHGIEGMSFRAIALEYGCSAAMPYTYFASKADLVDGLRVRSYEWIRGVLAVAASAETQPLPALEAVAEAYVAAAAERPRMYELLYTGEGAMSETEPSLIEAKAAALGVCRDVIAAAAEADQLVLATDPDTAAHLFWVAAHGLVSLDHGGFLVMGRDVGQILPVLFTTMVQGLTEPHPTSEAS